MTKAYCLVFLLVSMATHAQMKISGRVTDNRNTPLPGISVLLKNTYDGTTTDSTGKFSFTTTEKGEQLLSITSTGYHPFEQKITLAGSTVEINITLKELVTELKAVVISAGAF